MARSTEFWRVFLARCVLYEAVAAHDEERWTASAVPAGKECPWKDPEAFKEGGGVCYRTRGGTEYTYGDFLSLTDGRKAMARRLFDVCAWQHPEALLQGFEEEGVYRVVGER